MYFRYILESTWRQTLSLQFQKFVHSKLNIAQLESLEYLGDIHVYYKIGIVLAVRHSICLQTPVCKRTK